jgi:hypothetical protein
MPINRPIKVDAANIDVIVAVPFATIAANIHGPVIAWLRPVIGRAPDPVSETVPRAAMSASGIPLLLVYNPSVACVAVPAAARFMAIFVSVSDPGTGIRFAYSVFADMPLFVVCP